MADFAQTLMTTLAVGSLYALIALGYTMVYGILKFINFAHSDVVVWGSCISCWLATKVLPRLGVDTQSSPPIWVAALVLLIAMFACSLLGYAIERFAYRPLRNAPRLNVLITAIGVSLLLQNIGQLEFVFGTAPQTMPALIPNVTLASLTLPNGDSTSQVIISLVDVLIIGTSATLVVLLHYLVFHTRLGTAMRAVAFDFDAAALMGVPVNRVVSFTFMLGSALAAAAGFFYAIKYTDVKQPAHELWVLFGLKAFVAAVIGGIGNVRGAVLGGFVIAGVEQFGAFYLSSAYRNVYVFALLIAILLVRPSGLLGSTVQEKV